MGWQQATPEQIWGEYEPPPGAQNEEDDMNGFKLKEEKPWLKPGGKWGAPAPYAPQANGAGWQQWIWPAAIVGGAFLLFSALRR